MNYKDSVAEKFARQVKVRTEKLKKDKSLSRMNRNLILDFIKKSVIRDDIQSLRILKTINTMSNLARMAEKDLDKTNRQDIEKIVQKIRDKYKAEWTRHDYLVFLKKFYKYMEGDFIEYPDKVKWVKTTHKKSRETADVYLNQEDVKKMVSMGNNFFEKAASATLFPIVPKPFTNTRIAMFNLLFDYIKMVI